MTTEILAAIKADEAFKLAAETRPGGISAEQIAEWGRKSVDLEIAVRCGADGDGLRLLSFAHIARDRFGPVEIRRFEVPLPLHMQWCEWCAENCEGGGLDA